MKASLQIPKGNRYRPIIRLKGAKVEAVYWCDLRAVNTLKVAMTYEFAQMRRSQLTY